ncbi:endoglin isoform 1-T1 [Clarias gariepinus]|uniref:endoglin isoform X1 n=1 Tax=Clarias gariepinus TaxID=13013 RepID=UPI00234C1E96|nr:endoglin isoform X1 [Clarias gariepinus]
METFSTILALLMIFSASAASGSSLCEPKGIYRKESTDKVAITVDEMTDGCLTNYATKNGTEVHIINLLFASVNDNLMMSVTTAGPAILIFTSPDTLSKPIYILLNSNFDTSIYAQNGTTVIQVRKPVQQTPDVQGQELVSWAEKQFGGVSSFTTVNAPKMIEFTGVKGAETVCDLRLEVPTNKTSPKVQSDEQAVKSCCLNSQDKLHIINIPDYIDVRNVSVDVVTSGIKLVLRGPVGMLWKIDTLGVSFMSNNAVQLNNRLVNWPKNFSDNAAVLQNQALSLFKSKSISSYTEIFLNSPLISIRIEEREQVTEKNEVATTASPRSYTKMQLFTSPDYTAELNPTTKVQTDKRLYAQVQSLVHGGLLLVIQVKSCFVRSKGIHPVEKHISIKEEPCLECPNMTRFSFSFENVQDQPSNTWELQCNISHCTPNYAKSCAEPQLVKKTVLVTPSYVAPASPCFEFSLQSVLGVAFGGFLIGVLLVSALWFIKIRTGYPIALGFGPTGTFFSGCPCGPIKRHAVPTNPSPSENSSANGSMSSTQSTPTSSMA